MGKPLIGILSAAALTSFATCAGAMPIAPPVAPTSGVEQVRLVCDEWGRCWRQPDYYRRYGYYGHRYDDDDCALPSLSVRVRRLWSALGRLRLASRLA
jgi:hypothetical protein